MKLLEIKTTLISFDVDSNLLFWNTISNCVMKSIKLENICGMVVSGDSNLLTLSLSQGSWVQYDTDLFCQTWLQDSVFKEMSGHELLSVNYNGHIIAGIDAEKNNCLTYFELDLDSNVVKYNRESWKVSNSRVLQIDLLRKRRQVVICDSEGLVTLWDLDNMELIASSKNKMLRMTWSVISDSDKFFIVSDLFGNVFIFSLEVRSSELDSHLPVIRTFNFNSEIIAGSISGNGYYLGCAGMMNETIKVFELADLGLQVEGWKGRSSFEIKDYSRPSLQKSKKWQHNFKLKNYDKVLNKSRQTISGLLTKQSEVQQLSDRNQQLLSNNENVKLKLKINEKQLEDEIREKEQLLETIEKLHEKNRLMEDKFNIQREIALSNEKEALNGIALKIKYKNLKSSYTELEKRIFGENYWVKQDKKPKTDKLIKKHSKASQFETLFGQELFEDINFGNANIQELAALINPIRLNSKVKDTFNQRIISIKKTSSEKRKKRKPQIVSDDD